MTAKIQAILWDMDGVLIDSEPGYNVAIREMLASFGRSFGAREIALVTGSSFRNFASILQLNTVPPEQIQQQYIAALLGSIRANVKELVPGLPLFLDRFAERGIKQALGSSSPREVVNFAAEKFLLHQWMNVIVTGTEIAHGKPAPDIFLACAEQLGTAPAQCLVIEDSLNGVKAARAAGMRVAAFTGTQRHNFDLSDADFSLAAYDEDNWRRVVDLL